MFLALISQAVQPADVLTELLTFVGGLKGASVLAISVGVTQLLMKFFNSSLANFAGKYKLLVVSALSLVASVLGSFASGASIMNALMSGAVLASVQVFGHQVYLQFFASKDAA